MPKILLLSAIHWGMSLLILQLSAQKQPIFIFMLLIHAIKFVNTEGML